MTRTRRALWLLPLLCLTIVVPSPADYVEELKEKCRFYRGMVGRFAPMYGPLAQQMIEDYDLESGVANPWAMRLCGVLADEAGLTSRVIPVEADALDMPLKDDFADLVFSRGCIPFVDDQVKFLEECYRVLKPGGVGYVGHGGFGRLLDPEVRAALVEWRLEAWKDGPPEGWNGPGDSFPELAELAGIKDYKLIKEPDVGWWLEFRK